MSQPDRRIAKLKSRFRETVAGKHPLRTPNDAQLFLEAVRIQPSAPQCVEILVSSPAGLTAVREAVRANLAESFILTYTLSFLRYLSDPGVKSLADGQLLEQVLLAVANPPTFLTALIKLFEGHKLPDAHLASFAWLVLELLSLRPQAADSLDGTSALLSTSMNTHLSRLLQSTDHTARELGYKIEKVIQLRASPNQRDGAAGGPGGRHDNDFADFREIKIYPTTDEFLSKQPPYYQTAREVAGTEKGVRVSTHLDNQFRMLREDMMGELRENIQDATSPTTKKKPSKHRPATVLSDLVPHGITTTDTTNTSDPNTRFKKCTLLLRCETGIPGLRNVSIGPGPNAVDEMATEGARKRYLKDQPSLLRHQSFGVLCRESEIIAFAFVDRDVDKLIKTPPIVSLQFTDERALGKALLALRHGAPKRDLVRFVLVDTPVFTYEPVLMGLQNLADVPLLDVLVNPEGMEEAVEGFEVPGRLREVVERLKGEAMELGPEGVVMLREEEKGKGKGKKVTVDMAQLRALVQALTRPVSLIQGPPGTGKSFMGAQIARLLSEAGRRILVLSYTNHALDQFLEDLMKAGIPRESLVRLGSKAKCTPQTESLLLWGQRGEYRRTRTAWQVIEALRSEATGLVPKLHKAFQEFVSFSPKWDDIEEYLEFADGGFSFLEALRVPVNDEDDSWDMAGKGGHKVTPDYLYKLWLKGDGPKAFSKQIPATGRPVWQMSKADRQKHHDKWTQALAEEQVQVVSSLARQFNDLQSRIAVQFSEGEASVVLAKQIIGCTTTAAAKHARLIRAAKPDVILIEEAGEILESHVLTALSDTVRQIVLIGDHKQLRPKIANYALSVERGDGFDLNRSLFERLVLLDHPHVRHATLHKQHRMAPELSQFARKLTYPNLLDGPNTANRPAILGLRDRVIFLHHTRPEDIDTQLRDRRDHTAAANTDPGIKASKRNQFEAEMVLRTVRYLFQQGYAPDEVVLLTPYLGQVRVLRDLLVKNQHDPVLSEADKNELVKMGIVSEAAAKVGRTPLRVSTIDNYQGEESDIVIISLTRSNDSGDIGFMSAPERLNVLLTRARNGMILIGNMSTFLASKKGHATWHPFFEILREGGHVYDGLPVQCQKHPQTTALLKQPVDFDTACPEGGCTEMCNAPLPCTHLCPSRCHRLTNHSSYPCHAPITLTCPRHHTTKTRCSTPKHTCAVCRAEDAETERRAKRDLNLERERLRREAEYTAKLMEIQDEVDWQRRLNRDVELEGERREELKRQREELKTLKEKEGRLKREEERRKGVEEARERAVKAKQKKNEVDSPTANKPDEPSDINGGEDGGWAASGAQAEWEAMKADGAESKPLNTLMGMIGLEGVKEEFLGVKSRVDTALRQGISMKEERYSCVMLGNPGTGKTTVARLYAQFLTDLGVIPGNNFQETTGASLAHAGVNGCQKLLDTILNAGGGVLFIDEAYQLTSGNNPGGGAVLDFLLAEVENLRGKVVFVLAGYNRQMESFFAHNPGLPSRFPVEMKFADYTDDELLRILGFKVQKKYNGAMDCEDGFSGLYCRIVARRVGRARGTEGFGNARAMENVLDRIARRQSNRLRRERKKLKGNPDKKQQANINDFFFTKEDLIGPEPANALTKCNAWKKVQNLVGLGAVKKAVQALVDSIQQNYTRELQEKPLIEYSLNKVFLGNPGTGKTTVAKLYGEILVALGLLSKGEVIIKKPADFVGAHLGGSEQQTKGILASTEGKVLVIDEAYGLYGGGGGSGGTSDPYKTAVIDTIVAEVQSVPGDDRCVLLLGYTAQMEDMFQNVNPGLARRFPIASGFQFDDFDADELRKIFNMKVKGQGYTVTDQAANVAMEILNRARNRPNFGNAGEIDILLDTTKARHQTRLARLAAAKTPSSSPDVLEAIDFDEHFDRASRSETNVRKLFEGTVGQEDVISRLECYQKTVRTMKSLDMDPKETIDFNFLFRGPPGTGKTTTAKKMGKVFYDMGFLASAEVIECSASDLIGQYVGQTGPKVHQLFDRALGRVLFVDEAYRLAEGHFAKEAMDEIVDSVTKDKYFKKLVIILAGYEADINRLMSVNSGLTSRFPAVIDFRALTPDECIDLLRKVLQRQKTDMEAKSKRVKMDLSCLDNPSEEFQQGLVQAFTELTTQDNWASARDVQSLARNMFKVMIGNSQEVAAGRVVLTEEIALDQLRDMSRERASRAQAKTSSPLQDLQKFLQPAPLQNAPLPPKLSTTHAHAHAHAHAEAPAEQQQDPPRVSQPEEEDDKPSPPSQPQLTLQQKPQPAPPQPLDDALRDAGVSDSTWAQLQADRLAEIQREAEYQQLRAAADRLAEEAKESARRAVVSRLIAEDDEAKAEEERRRKEEEERRKEIVRRLLEAEERRKREEKDRAKLKALGRCPVGYEWIRQAGGYRCAGGSHWMGDGEFGRC
ncbi:helicase required for RNAi-mediated heterochromatin assembly 1 [Dichotomopilus funicola]|uniref:Helicase required for RNAi-mediated heterochromatin assembly 1 n=1 Tax=Dichotomopilus funicola TaxID=1934379 RepID=A0AAN6UYU7_9PEZI|nr:helicase required for RNAi-mediated heterochromatin assembly 1 [Dichotomopilus funicola]